MPEQLTIFIDNKPGRLNTVTGVLAENGINIRAMVITDRVEFGVAKLVVDQPQAALQALIEKKFAVALKPVIAAEIGDQPGGLHRLLQVLDGAGINIVDGYGFVAATRKMAVWCIEVKNPEAVAEVLRQNGVRLLTAAELYAV